ncbi:hypothetical protein [Sphingomonas sp.]|uniref:hypothetical protein n=1 Tax=Sphingomonas sp. TaxID=28214 RepID=UPI002FC69178
MPARKSPPDDTRPSNTDSSNAEGASDIAAGAEGKQSDAMRNKKLATRVAVGIGSAAIVAALLYAGRNKIGDRDK